MTTVLGWIAIGCLIWAAVASMLVAWIHIATRIASPPPPAKTYIDVAVEECLPEMWRQIHAGLKRPQP